MKTAEKQNADTKVVRSITMKTTELREILADAELGNALLDILEEIPVLTTQQALKLARLRTPII